jgi:hypothetical protein
VPCPGNGSDSAYGYCCWCCCAASSSSSSSSSSSWSLPDEEEQQLVVLLLWWRRTVRRRRLSLLLVVVVVSNSAAAGVVAGRWRLPRASCCDSNGRFCTISAGRRQRSVLDHHGHRHCRHHCAIRRPWRGRASSSSNFPTSATRMPSQPIRDHGALCSALLLLLAMLLLRLLRRLLRMVLQGWAFFVDRLLLLLWWLCRMDDYTNE